MARASRGVARRAIANRGVMTMSRAWHAPRERRRLASPCRAVSAAPSARDGALRGGEEPPRRLLAARPRALQRSAASLRRRRVSSVLGMRRLCTRLRETPLPRVRRRGARRRRSVFVQAARPMPKLCGPADGRQRGALGRLCLARLCLPPVRQFVLAYPYELSGLAATRPDVLSALSRLFWDALRLRYRTWAKASGLGGHGLLTASVRRRRNLRPREQDNVPRRLASRRERSRPEHPLVVALGAPRGRRALRAARPLGLANPSAPHLQPRAFAYAHVVANAWSSAPSSACRRSRPPSPTPGSRARSPPAAHA